MSTQADEIAWEQVRYWRTYMTAQEASQALGWRCAKGWAEIARQLAVIWLLLHERENIQMKRAA